MFTFGLLVFLFGALGLCETLGLNIAAPNATTISSGLMATREMFVTATSALCIVGAIFMGCGSIRNELRRSKISSKKAKKAEKTEKRELNLDGVLELNVEAPRRAVRLDRAVGGGCWAS